MENSILNFLTSIHGALAENENLRLDITRSGDSLDIIVLPLLSDDETKVPEEAKQVRSALSMPLAMRNMSLDELSTEFGERLSGYGQVRQQANDAYQELLMSLKDATANAKNSKSKAEAKTKPKAKNDSPAVQDDEEKQTQPSSEALSADSVQPEAVSETDTENEVSNAADGHELPTSANEAFKFSF
ncbi:MAG TPA: hypothetical protein ENI26_08105 [Methylophaga aminisulfidivorans]|uniref:PRTRC system protein E n=2 Tax=root TaxID=1 RepID=A0A7C1VS06_9GAMM|nr:hypothetical protein [Methylophaga sp.]HEC74320.1 hypothetical protein [Methylophaga aminisulfidivorans]